MSKVDDFANIEVPRTACGLSQEEFHAEEPRSLDEILASVDLASSRQADTQLRDETIGAEAPLDPEKRQITPAWAPHQPPEPAATMSPTAHITSVYSPSIDADTTFLLGQSKRARRRLRISRRTVAILAVVFLLATLGTGFVAMRQNAAAGSWRQHDRTEVARNRTEVARNRVLSANLTSAHLTITSANVSIVSLQAQLSAVASAKAKALDQNAVLTSITNQAGVVSNKLSTCVNDMDSLITEIGNDLSNLSYNDPYLQSNATVSGQVCSTAQQDNQQLQSILKNAG